MQLSLKEEGHSFLFRGIGSTVIRAFPMNAVTFGVFTLVMKKWGYKPEEMEHDTIENLQRKLNSGVCEVTFVFRQADINYSRTRCLKNYPWHGKRSRMPSCQLWPPTARTS